MLRPLLFWLGERYQRRLGVATPYFDEVVRHAPGALVPILGFVPATAYGSRTPDNVLHMVRLGATVAQDCGTCLEIGVRMARRAGVAANDVEAAVRGRATDLAPELAAAVRFGDRIARLEDAPAERDVIRAHFGEGGLVEASIAAAGAMTFPVLQRGLGFARTCTAPGVQQPGDDRSE
jgi:alkylhydroperoxidase family enzyme